MSRRLPRLTAAIYRDLLCRTFKTEDAEERARQQRFDAFLAKAKASTDLPARDRASA